jgi:hypothetical protein
VEKLFYVKPGADPSKIQVQVDGAKGLKLSKDGEIIIKTDLGDLKLSKPIAWQEKDGKKLPVKVSYKLIGKNRYSFVVAKADPSLPIVIDPILQATYLGGSDSDGAYALAIHPTTGEVYVAGATSSNDFPVTTGVVQESYRGGIGEYPYDAFVARLNSTLTQILKATYLGGSGGDDARALAIHPTTGEVYVAGATSSNDFPNTDGGAKESKDDYMDAFVAKLDSDLTSLQSTYLGGSRWDGVYALAISSDGYVYVAGETSSDDFPNTDGGAKENFGGDSDAFVVKLDSTLTNSSFQATYLGGSSDDGAYAIAIHPTTGDVYVAGKTRSFNFPNTDGGAQGSKGNYYDAFVAKLDSDLTSLQSTYLGGNGDYDEAYALAISSDGYVYVAGGTDSTNFPGTSGGAQGSSGGESDAFVAKRDLQTGAILQSTYLGGSDDDYAYALAFLQVAMSMWRDIPIPPTFPALLAGRRKTMPITAATLTPLWQGSVPTCKQVPSSNPHTWEEAVLIVPPPLPFQVAMSMWRDGPLPPTFLAPLVGRGEPMAVARGTPLWQSCLLIWRRIVVPVVVAVPVAVAAVVAVEVAQRLCHPLWAWCPPAMRDRRAV